MKRGSKLIAKLLCFVLVAMTVLGYGSLKVEAKGNGTTFTITVTNQSEADGNKVEYQANSTGEWIDATGGKEIDISEMNSITVKVKKAEGVKVTCTGNEGLAGTDVNGVTEGKCFEFIEGTSYGLEITFTTQSGDDQEPTQGNAGLRIDIANQNSATGTVYYQFFKGNEFVDAPVGISSSTTIPFSTGITKMIIKVVPGTNCQVGNYGVNVNGTAVSDASKEAAKSENGNAITVSEPTKEYQVQVEFTQDNPEPEKKEEKKEEKKVETVVQKEASTKEKAPANIVQLPGGEKAVSSIGGVYNVESVEGVAVVTQKKDVYSAVGLSNEEVKAGTNVVLYMSDCLNKKTYQEVNDVAVAANKKVAANLTADMYTITKKGVINKVRETGAPVELLIGVPQSARSANRQFSVVCIDPSKNVVTYNDMDTNPDTITVRANVFGNYAVVY